MTVPNHHDTDEPIVLQPNASFLVVHGEFFAEFFEKPWPDLQINDADLFEHGQDMEFNYDLLEEISGLDVPDVLAFPIDQHRDQDIQQEPVVIVENEAPVANPPPSFPIDQQWDNDIQQEPVVIVENVAPVAPNPPARRRRRRQRQRADRERNFRGRENWTEQETILLIALDRKFHDAKDPSGIFLRHYGAQFEENHRNKTTLQSKLRTLRLPKYRDFAALEAEEIQRVFNLLDDVPYDRKTPRQLARMVRR